MGKRVGWLAALLVFAGSAHAEPPAKPPEAAAAFLAARKAGDEEAARGLAGRDDPDPWLVADELLQLSEWDAAAAFAKSAADAQGDETARLPEYVESKKGVDTVREREALDAANRALQARDFEAARAVVEPLEPKGDGVLSVRLQMVFGRSALALGRLEQAAALLRTAAESAERLGWLRRAARLLGESASAVHLVGNPRLSVEAWRRVVSVAGKTRDRALTASALGNLAGILYMLQEYAEARDAASEAVRLSEAEGARGEVARTLIVLAGAQEKLGELDAAEAALRRAKALGEEIGDPRARLAAADGLGTVSLARGDLAGAMSAFEEALAGAESAGLAPFVLTIRSHVAAALNAQGRFREARETYDQVIAEAVDPTDRGARATALANRGHALWRLGEYVPAESSYVEARRAAEELGDRQTLLAAVHGLALVHEAMGDPGRAVSLLEEAQALARAIGNAVEEARVIGSQGKIRRALGDYEGAVRLLEECVARFRRLGRPGDLAAAISDLGSIELETGRTAIALAHLEEALRLVESTSNPAALSGTLLALAGIHWQLGDLSQATGLAERAVAMQEQAGMAGTLATSWSNRAVLLLEVGDLDGALDAARRGVEAGRRVGDRQGTAHALLSEGTVLERRRHSEAAAGRYEEAARAWAELGSAFGESSARSRLAGVLTDLGRLEAARREAESAHELARRLDAPGARVDALAALTRVELSAGDPASAMRRAREAGELVTAEVEGLGDEQGAAARENRSAVYAYGVLAALAAGSAGDAFFFLEDGRAGALREALGGRGASRELVQDEALKTAEQQARGEVSVATHRHRHVLRDGDRSETRASRRELEAARDRHRLAVEAIQRSEKRAAAIAYPRPARLEQVQESLGEGDALVVFGLHANRALAVVLDRNGGRLVDLGPPGPIEAACARVLESDRGPDDDAGLAEVRHRVVEPLSLPATAGRLLLSPHGVLSYLPWSALVGARDAVLLPSASTWVLLRADAAERGEGVLAVGDPSYGTTGGAPARESQRTGDRLVPLPATRDEAKAVGDVLLLGEEATEGRLRDALATRPRWRAVHFACHGLVDPERPTFSSLALTASEQDDGFLTALEVYRLRMPADLVVLSACETGRGRVYAAEGIVGLTRAFMFAGAPRVLVSLWKVDDRATRLLMEDLYRNWKAGGSVAQALRKAQESLRTREEEVVDPEASRLAGREVRKKTRPFAAPRYWAAWVLWGAD